MLDLHNQLIIIVVTKYLLDSKVVNGIESKYYPYVMNWEKMIHEGDAWARDKPALKGEINKGREEEHQEHLPLVILGTLKWWGIFLRAIYSFTSFNWGLFI